MVRTFPSLRWCLMVGIGGGVPVLEGQDTDVHLGDVVVSNPDGNVGGVVQYDFGKENQGFARTGSLNEPPTALRNAVTAIRAQPNLALAKTLEKALSEAPGIYPGSQHDQLYQAWYDGFGASQRLWGLFREKQFQRQTTRDQIPVVHYGLIASGNKVIKRAAKRDEIVTWLKQDTNGGKCLCFEMDAAGLMNYFPCLVIRGISDYSDSHKNDEWHDYAALTAAAYAKQFLHVLQPADVTSLASAEERMRQDVQEMKAEVRNLTNLASDEAIRDWLKPANQSADLCQVEDELKNYSATNTWFFEHKNYAAWSSRHSHHLWVYGASGCGKTVLASKIIRALQENGLCLFFFFNFYKEQKLRDVLCSFLHQLHSSNLPKCKEPLQRLYASIKNPTVGPTTDELKRTFDETVRLAGDVPIVLDALDESKGGSHRSELLEWLRRQIQSVETKQGNIRIIMTSRDQPDIVAKLGYSIHMESKISIEDERERVEHDIHTYIQNRIRSDENFQAWKEADEDTIDLMVTKLLQKAGTMFRWVALQLDCLAECADIHTVKQVLQDLPAGLHEVYARAVQQIPPMYKKDAVRLLQLLLFSGLKLTENDVLEAMKVNPDGPPGSRVIDRGWKMGMAPFKPLFSSLIKWVPSKRRKRIQKDQSHRVLQIAHASVRDYLVTNKPEPYLGVSFTATSTKAALVELHLAYFETTTSTVTTLANFTSFAKHSEKAWITHSHIPEVEEISYDTILRFLVYNGSKLQSRTAGIFGSMYAGPPLYVASAIGLTKTVERLLKEGVGADEMGGIDGFRKTAALEGSYYKKKLDELHIFELPEVSDGKKNYHPGSALQAACYNGHESIVRLLLPRNPPVNMQTPDEYANALHATCYGSSGDQKSRKAIVEMLLKEEANANAQGGSMCPRI
ncbi:hypothetical protein SLS58_005831 [Diplodia intermedia]|uniref:Nephrocystin 3-like N-terminal domain-containing protein n=1 Tax=Diplodia intermedia TaxID=856260 RepID=A0ABR3TQ98_9PEZI